VLSRCQRFDLRRVEAGLLIDHLAMVAGRGGGRGRREALRMIARAAEGSVRDALSLLDQAVAYGGRSVPAADVQVMLGLADRARTIDLFEALMRGHIAQALEEFEAQRALGSDPYVILSDLAEFVHWVTRLKVLPEGATMPPQPGGARARAGFAGELGDGEPGAGVADAAQGTVGSEPGAEPGDGRRDGAGAHRLCGGTARTGDARRGPGAAAGGRNAPAGQQRPRCGRRGRRPDQAAPSQAVRMAPQQSAAPASSRAGTARTVKLRIASVDELCRHRGAGRRQARHQAQDGPGAFGPAGARRPGAPRDRAGARCPSGPAGRTARKLEAWTGTRWLVLVSKEAGEKPLAATARERRESLFREARDHPDVKAVLERFPGAEIVDVRDDAAPDASPDEAFAATDDDTD
jgi:DNA polymerase III subunit gamma/tau